jgi:hypothetical protein
MVRRRAEAAGITTEVCNHTFRGTGITAYRYFAGAPSPKKQGWSVLETLTADPRALIQSLRLV